MTPFRNAKGLVLKIITVAAINALLAGATASAQTGPFGIATIAGTPYDPTGENGPATKAATGLSGVAFRDGNLYLTDNNRIRKIGPNGIITTIAGQLDAVVHQPIPATPEMADPRSPLGFTASAHLNSTPPAISTWETLVTPAFAN